LETNTAVASYRASRRSWIQVGWMAAMLVSVLAVGWFGSVGFAHSAAAQSSGVLRRTTDGKPDLSGIWQAMNGAEWDLLDHAATKGVPAGKGIVEGNEIPYRPEALLKKKENFTSRETADPLKKCFLPGVPRIMYLPYPFQIAQGPNQIQMLFEYVHAVRNIFLTGQHYPPPIDWWLGDARGRWDGDTLVVDVIDFNDVTWFDQAGDFHSDQLHVVERYTPTGPDHIQYEATIEDPKTFTRPWKIGMTLYRHKEKDAQLLEYECFAYETPEPRSR
jgi:hypothetical protein